MRGGLNTKLIGFFVCFLNLIILFIVQFLHVNYIKYIILMYMITAYVNRSLYIDEPIV